MRGGDRTGGEGRGVQRQDWEGAGVLAPAAVAKCHRLVAYRQQTFISHTFRGWKSKIGGPTDPASGEGLLPGL